jgi:hypothetical protein
MDTVTDPLIPDQGPAHAEGREPLGERTRITPRSSLISKSGQRQQGLARLDRQFGVHRGGDPPGKRQRLAVRPSQPSP